MRRYYPALLHKEPDSAFGVSFPDFPGCIAGADSEQEAMIRAEEALALHLEGRLEDGAALPEPRSVAAARAEAEADPDLAAHLLGVVLVPVAVPGRSKRYQVRLPEDLVEAIDAVASDRSRFLAEAARAELERRRGA